MTKNIEKEIINELKSLSDKDFAKWVAPILQITENGYGNGDKLYGIRTPILRNTAKKYTNIDNNSLEVLLKNEYHEVRMLALLILIHKFDKEKDNKKYVEIYLKHADYINNWDLVDITAPKVIGKYLWNNKKELNLLENLSKSNHLWKERIAIVSTLYLIKQGFFTPTLKLAEKYIHHPHHLIHKATGWMLREIGKKDINVLYKFLDKYAGKMPRVMLRYSLEKMDKNKKNYYMHL